ncbi:MAG: DUF4158 domain-containing protein [Stellaceae bacterium]
MNRWEHRYLGQARFPDALPVMEVEHFFTWGENGFAAVRCRRTALNQLALALQISFLKLTGGTLNSVEIIPAGVLEHLGRQLGCAPPRIASIRALYRRRRTLFDHQAAALLALGRREPSEHAERGLVAYLRREAAAVFDNAELMARARSWLVDHDYLLRRERDLRRLVGAARRHQEQILFKTIAAIAGPDRETWLPRLLAPIEEDGMIGLEWLGAVPAGKGPTSLETQIAKVGFLKELGANRLGLSDLPLAGLQHFARRMMGRKAAALARLKDPHRTIEVACFLRLRLRQLTDASLTLLDHRIAAHWRGARERVAVVQASRLRRLQRLLGDLAALAEDEALGAGELRSRLRTLIAPFAAERGSTRVAAIRQELGHKSPEMARLLRTVRAAELTMPAGHAVAAAFATLDALAAAPNGLPADAPQPFGPSWQALIDQPDRMAALGCFRAATVMALKRGLRNGAITADHSVSHRAAEDKLIPAPLWQRSRARFLRDLNLPVSAEKYLQRLEAGLSAGLAALAEAVTAGAVAVTDGELRLPRRKPVPKDPRIEPARQALTRAVGQAQLPEVMIETDHLTRFSWTLLGRPARSERELVTLYAGLIGLGSNLSEAELVRIACPGEGRGCRRWRPTASPRWFSGSRRTAGCAPPTTRCCASCAGIASPACGGAACSPRPI